MDAESELLLGIHEADRDATASFVDRLKKRYPEAQLKVVFRTQPDDVANPKIAWQKILAPQAEGELWLWSDADVLAPPDFLETARAEFARGNEPMMTFPYVIRDIPRPPALLETLFVNTEFYPGVLLLRRFGTVDFGLGAAMLFARDEFLRRIDWNELGACLADDFHLGQKLGPVRVGSVCVTTFAGATTWSAARAHDLRWTKTIRWNRPGGSLARILVMPVLGWIGLAAWHPQWVIAWLGLAGMMQLDVIFAVALCAGAGCKIGWREVPGLETWSLWRVAAWLLAWLPLPVYWCGREWAKPVQVGQ
jgi:ceramide glucosyltransferase